MTRRLDRRTFLRGAGATLALPFLDAMLPRLRAAPEDAPVRLLFVFVPNGKHMADWWPAKPGPLQGELPFLLQPLTPHKASLLVLGGLGHDTARAHGDGPGDHARASATFLTGAHPVKTSGADIRVGTSVDQVAASRIGRATRFPSLELGIERGRRAGRCDSGYSCAYVSNVSWRSPTTPNAKEVVPRRVFERLFGGQELSPTERARRRALRESVLDVVRADARALAKKLGKGDRLRLDEYLTAVRELERRLEDAETEPVAPELELPFGVPRDLSVHMRLMCDLLVLAFQSDLTRVASLMFANAGSNRTYRFIDVPEGHHRLSHHGRDPEKQAKIRRIDRFHMEQLAYLTRRLAEAPAGGGSLLDQSLVVYGSGIADGNRHDHHDLPVLLLGGGGGAARGGRYVRSPRRTPLCNLYVSVLDAAGVRVSSFGDSTGRLDLA